MKRHLVALGVFGLVALAVGQPNHAYDIERGRGPRYDATNPAPSRWELPAHWLDLAQGGVPHDRALAATFGASYDSSERVDYALLTYQWLFDYRDVWLHNAPPDLKLKIELSAGARTNNEPRFMGSGSVLAMYFLPGLATEHLQPYVEAGVGIIYTDFQREGQGLRWNFNPQLGIGTLIRGDGAPWLVALRLSHISNAGLAEDNAGINALSLTVGRYF